MECPACKHQLSHILVDGIELDICHGGCGGIWFDTFEFKKFDDPHEESGTELLNIPIDPSIDVDHSERRRCPKCENITLMRHYYSVKQEVEIDDCANCAGVWLDAGELNNIRNQFDSDEERRAAAAAVFDELFGPQLEVLRREQEKDLARVRRVANMLRFICPSYYLSGKKDWGVFYP